MHKVRLDYRPAGPTLAHFHRSDAFVRAVTGPLGSGKTTACAVEIWRRAIAQSADREGVRRSRWLVVRSTYPELETTTIKSWRALFDDRFGPMSWGHPPIHRLNARLADGTRLDAEVIFMALDEPDGAEKIRGLELTGAWFNEVREIPKAIVDMATGRVGRYPARRDGGANWFGVIADTNMPDEDHWLYRFAEEAPPEGWAFFRQPGGLAGREGAYAENPAAENRANLPAHYYRNQLAGKSTDWVKVYLLAEYGFVQEGRPVYPEYADRVHCRAVEPVAGLPIYLGADFGLTPAAILAQRLPDGRVIWLDELATEEMGAVRFAERLRTLLNERYGGFELARAAGDPAGTARAQTDERTVFDILRARGLPFRPAPSNDFAVRREAVAAPLGRLIDGEPGLMISPRCRVVRKGMAGRYAYKRVRMAGEERFADKPDKNFYSHACEAGQYLMLGMGEGRRLTASERPRIRPVRADDDYDPLGNGRAR